MTILWIMDRFGVPGQYHRIWVRLLRDNHVPANQVQVFQLHKHLKRTLLCKLGSRKAPTWIPEEENAICKAIDGAIAHLKPQAVVLSSPESLAVLGLAPEHATLHNLRGSVYWRAGVPHLVMLPMSAWTALVSQKEIGAANYGFESEGAFKLAHAGPEDGQVHEQAEAGQGTRRPAGGSSAAGLRDQADAGTGGDSDSAEGESDEEGDAGDSIDNGDGDSDHPVADPLDEPDKENGDMDQFFYEPVLSPVGRFVLTADVQKLHRLLRDGRDASGPSQPIQLNWR